MTWRADAELLQRVRLQAQEHGRSLNDWVTTVLAAASDSTFAGSDADRVRERLARAGLLEARNGATTGARSVRRPDGKALAAAKAAAGRGTPLSELVVEGRR